MRKMIIALVASAASIASVSAAYAADAIDSVPQAPSAPVSAPAVGNWAGGYVGATGSWNWGPIKNSGYANAFGLGGYGGYNFQDGQLVYGVEGNVDYNGAQRTTNGIKTETGVNGALRGRLGVDMNPFLLYGAAGIAAGSVKVSDGAGNSDSRGVIGWTAGVGAETKVTDNVTARVEYDYTSFGNRTYVLGGTNVSRGYDQNAVKVGIGYKF
ncbi:MAG TPA: outer membrane protein [Ensifer sp.]|nr:outer membrane protein [Ensifer sp.]